MTQTDGTAQTDGIGPHTEVTTADGSTSRRGMLRAALGAAAAVGVGAAGLSLSSGTASANTGDTMLVGRDNFANVGTEVKWNGPSGFTGVLLLANDSLFSDGGALFPAAAGGWAGGGPAGVANGVYGYTAASPTLSTTANGVVGVATQGTGVLGQTFSASAASIGVSGVSAHGTGVSGTSTNGTGVSGSGNLQGISGTASASNGTGVAGSGPGTGVSGIGTGPAGFGVSGIGSIGVTGDSSSTNGIGTQGLAFGPGGRGVAGNSSGSGGTGVLGLAANGRGGVFSGGSAALQLVAASAPTHPASGQVGDLFVDSSGNLWFCKGGTTWKQLA